MSTTEVDKKQIKIGPFKFTPIFEINQKQGVEHKEIECKQVVIELDGKEGEEAQRYVIDFETLYLFIYFCASEELRQQLALHYERQISYIPYEVSFKLEEQEKAAPIVKRRIELPVDEISMAVARQHGWDMFLKGKYGNTDYGSLWKQLQAQSRASKLKK